MLALLLVRCTSLKFGVTAASLSAEPQSHPSFLLVSPGLPGLIVLPCEKLTYSSQHRKMLQS